MNNRSWHRLSYSTVSRAAAGAASGRVVLASAKGPQRVHIASESFTSERLTSGCADASHTAVPTVSQKLCDGAPQHIQRTCHSSRAAKGLQPTTCRPLLCGCTEYATRRGQKHSTA